MARYLVVLVIATVCLFGVFAMSAYAAPTAATDETAPVTTCDAHAAYTGNATIHLAATDNDGGWGVAYVYYKLDTGYAHCVPVGTDASTSVAVVAPTTGSAKSATHTLTFWSQDKAGNVEARASKTFTVSAAKTVTSLSLKRSKSTVKKNQYFTLSGAITPAAVSKVTVHYKKPGTSAWKTLTTRMTSAVGRYSYRYRTRVKRTWSFRATFKETSAALGSTSPIIKVRVR